MYMFSLAPIPEPWPHQEICWELEVLPLCLSVKIGDKWGGASLKGSTSHEFEDLTSHRTFNKGKTNIYPISHITVTATWWIVMERMAGDLWRHPVIAKHQLCVPWSWTLLLAEQWDQDTHPRRRRRIYQIVLRPVRFPCLAPTQSPSATNKPCTLPTLLDLKPFLGSNSEWGGGLLLQHNLEKKDMYVRGSLSLRISSSRERHQASA